MKKTSVATVTIEGSAMAVASAFLTLKEYGPHIQDIKVKIDEEKITMTIGVTQSAYSSERVLITDHVAKAFLEEIASMWNGYS